MNPISNSYKEFQGPKKILVIGRGGRENSLAWALKKSTNVKEVWIAPGNGGSTRSLGCQQLNFNESDKKGLIRTCQDKEIDLIVIGPEAPLAEGLADTLRAHNFPVFGPSKAGSQIESSKAWAKELMREQEIPTAKYWTATNEQEALGILEKFQKPLVIKADGLAAGKGVIVPDSIQATIQAINHTFKDPILRGNKVILEEVISGPEVSIFALCDGKKMVILPPAQDHKRLRERDQGPNTGGMGAYTPAKVINDKELYKITEEILKPTLNGLVQNGIDYKGVIYAGLMLTKDGPKVIEFNCRFGDPECQALMPLMGPELADVIYACAKGNLALAPNLTIKEGCSACVILASEGYPNSPELNDIIKIGITNTNNIQVFHSGTKADSEGKVYTSGGRVLSIVGQGENFDDAFNIIYKEIEKISFKGMNYRRDIGYQVRSYWPSN